MSDISIKNAPDEIATIVVATYNYLLKNGSKSFDVGETSDGYHTFNELYHHRAILFSVICNTFPHLAWKSAKHHDGTMYDGMFIVGIRTPKGQATYHYDKEKYWNMFKVTTYHTAPEWDGHTPEQAIERLSSLDIESVKIPEYPSIFGL